MYIITRFGRFLRRRDPYICLVGLAVPLAVVEPLKLFALFILGSGHEVAGLAVIVCAYATSIFVVERLFKIVKPKLLELGWFAAIHRLRFLMATDR
jgi:hypothetical protein